MGIVPGRVLLAAVPGCKPAAVAALPDSTAAPSPSSPAGVQGTLSSQQDRVRKILKSLCTLLIQQAVGFFKKQTNKYPVLLSSVSRFLTADVIWDLLLQQWLHHTQWGEPRPSPTLTYSGSSTGWGFHLGIRKKCPLSLPAVLGWLVRAWGACTHAHLGAQGGLLGSSLWFLSGNEAILKPQSTPGT